MSRKKRIEEVEVQECDCPSQRESEMTELLKQIVRQNESVVHQNAQVIQLLTQLKDRFI